MSRATGTTAPNQLNLVGEGTVFEGTLRTPHDIRISGRVIGTLHVQGKAIIAAEGILEGELYASSADIAGRVQGDLVIEETLLLKETAQVEGRIQTGRLVVEAGAVFDGECRMGKVDRVIETKATPPTDKKAAAPVREAARAKKADAEPAAGT
ncbi:bactofilin family protein [Rhodothermus profundi]|uniref:Polymer-forming protein n=1 Tax=Rhodothermus profundi TaxID=633813 RepID=A0A1M6VXD2_9BACT|nr:polymer-forming cytoskeletal protein [Rhodothermus profundi]SHK86048.1 Polymer-forming protein [Rhodothermus profundi]